jgi:hypothetical protein
MRAKKKWSIKLKDFLILLGLTTWECFCRTAPQWMHMGKYRESPCTSSLIKHVSYLPFLLYSELLQHFGGPVTANCGHQCKTAQWVPFLEDCDHRMGSWQPAVGISPHCMNAQNTCSTNSEQWMHFIVRVK